MTNILIPTDFTAASLQLAVQAIHSVDASNVNIILFHAFEMPSSELELLSPHRPKPYAGLFTDSFRQECKQLKEQYPRAIQKICFKCMEGSGTGLFRNFVDANDIDLIYCPDHYQYKPIHKLSVDPRPLFKKSGTRVLRELQPQQETAAEINTPLMAPVFAAAN